jgi:hypothetical protein
MDAVEILQRLQQSGINGALFWVDDGCRWTLGDEHAGWTSRGVRATLAGAARDMAEAAAREHPGSPFADWWRGASVAAGLIRRMKPPVR